MFAARDVDGIIVWATDANKIEDYFCPRMWSKDDFEGRRRKRLALCT